MKSLRSQFLALIAACIMIYAVCILALMVWSLGDASRELDIDTLEIQAKIAGKLWDSSGGCNSTGGSPSFETLDNAFFENTNLAFKVVCAGQPTFISSHGFPKLTLPQKTIEVLNDAQGEEWLVASKTISGGTLYLASADKFGYFEYIYDIRILQSTLLPILLILLLIAYWVAGLILKPIKKLPQIWGAEGKANRTPKTFLELQGVNDFVLNLMSREKNTRLRNEELLTSERRFTANAAHELLTPLAAIKTEVQFRERATSDNDTKLWLSSLNERVIRAAHTVDQLITLARLEPGTSSEQLTNVNLCQLMDDIINSLQDTINSKKIHIERHYNEAGIVVGNAPLVSTMLRNLLNNAVKYVPDGENVKLSTRRIGDDLHLLIQNNCKQLPEYLADHIFDRFVRGPHEIETGSGLGLAIVEKISKAHNIKLAVDVPENRKSISITLIWPDY